MRTIQATIMLLVVFTLPAVADYVTPQSSDTKTIQQLLQQIEQLEKRVRCT